MKANTTQGYAQTIGSLVRQERKHQGLTQEQLGEFSGVGLNFISQLERGKETVRLDKVLTVLGVLGVEICLTRGKDGVVLGEEFSR